MKQTIKNIVLKSSFRRIILIGIGEIVLIVIGLVIALQIDQYIKDKERQEERIQILFEMRGTLISDYTAILYAKNSLDIIAETYFNLITNEYSDIEEFKRDILLINTFDDTEMFLRDDQYISFLHNLEKNSELHGINTRMEIVHGQLAKLNNQRLQYPLIRDFRKLILNSFPAYGLENNGLNELLHINKGLEIKSAYHTIQNYYLKNKMHLQLIENYIVKLKDEIETVVCKIPKTCNSERQVWTEDFILNQNTEARSQILKLYMERVEAIKVQLQG